MLNYAEIDDAISLRHVTALKVTECLEMERLFSYISVIAKPDLSTNPQLLRKTKLRVGTTLLFFVHSFLKYVNEIFGMLGMFLLFG